MLKTEKQIRRLFRQFPVMDMVNMEGKRPGRSRRSLYRDLSEIGYLSSYTHAGRYYTLTDIPDFDDAGLWWHQGVGFSKAGTLKSTVALLGGGGGPHARRVGVTDPGTGPQRTARTGA